MVHIGYRLLLAGVLLAGCHAPRKPAPQPDKGPASADPHLSVNTLLSADSDYVARRLADGSMAWPAYAGFLEGVKICLDPGHGGDAHLRGFKRGPTGVREAEMNLRVAQFLRELLEEAGAEVLLTREGDEDVSLRRRAEIANDWGADLFIS